MYSIQGWSGTIKAFRVLELGAAMNRLRTLSVRMKD